jgi:hypothetical protein
VRCWSKIAKPHGEASRKLDGYIEDEQGKIDWTAPDEETA